MNCIVPFNKEIKFNTNIAEITSISLEHEITLNDRSLLGNFLLSGEYKPHEVSVNTEKFNYTLPFDVTLPDNIDKDTINFEITDFTYNIVDGNTLAINIEFSVIGDEKNLEIKFSEPEKELIEESPVENEIMVENRDYKEDNQNTIMKVANSSDETFVTYRIHIVKTGETLETILNQYKELEQNILDYNDTSEIKIGHKLIIPFDE